MARPCAHVRTAELLEKLADLARVLVDAEPLGDDPLEVHPPPHDAVAFQVRTRLDDRGQLGQLIGRKTRRRTARLIVNEAVRTLRVEAMNPVAQGLAIHAPNLGRLAAIHSVANPRKRQKPPTLIDVLGARASARSSSA